MSLPVQEPNWTLCGAAETHLVLFLIRESTAWTESELNHWNKALFRDDSPSSISNNGTDSWDQYWLARTPESSVWLSQFAENIPTSFLVSCITWIDKKRMNIKLMYYHPILNIFCLIEIRIIALFNSTWPVWGQLCLFSKKVDKQHIEDQSPLVHKDWYQNMLDHIGCL